MKTVLTAEQKKARNVANQRKWRALNQDKVKAQKKRYYERHKKYKVKPYENEKEHQRLRKRLDTLFITDSYLKENVARRIGMKVEDVPQELLDLCRPLLELKRHLRDSKKMKDQWISVKDRMPSHHQIILVFAKTEKGVDGYGVATFVDSVKMNEELKKTPYANECVDVSKHPYYFVSQEVRQHTFKSVTHWMPLPEPPKNAETVK